MPLDPAFVAACTALGHAIPALIKRLPTGEKDQVSALYERYCELLTKCQELDEELRTLRHGPPVMEGLEVHRSGALRRRGADDGGRFCGPCTRRTGALVGLTDGIVLGEEFRGVGVCASCSATFRGAF